MKKIFFTILLLLTLVQTPAVLAAPVIAGQDLMARVTLDPTLKPSNSPGVVFSEDELGKPGIDGAFGSYILQMLAGGLITLAAPVAIIIIAASGLMAVISRGNQATMDKAKKTLTWAIIGLVVIIFSWVITRGVIDLVISTNQNPGQAPATTDSTNPPGEGKAPGAGSET